MASSTNWAAAASILAVLCTVSGAAALASEDAAPDPDDRQGTVLEAVEQGELTIDLRYRFEFVEEDPFTENAYASTLRSALTYESGSFRGLFAGLSLESVIPVGSDGLYNNRGAGNRFNGVTDRPAVADPEIAEIDRAYLGYRGPLGLELKVGRSDYILDNQRFVGIAPWRQNYRSFDLATFAIGRSEGWQVRYAYLDRVHYNSGASPKLSANLFHVSRQTGYGRLSAYSYLIDWDDEARAAFSSATYGARFEGSAAATENFDILYLVEYAQQNDYGNNPGEYGLDYIHLLVGGRRGPWSLQAAWELKDGDGINAVQTPLGTNHGKNGFADRLVVTPPDGSEDRYLRLKFDRERWSALLAFHDFKAAVGSATLGREVDFVARYTPAPPLSVFLKVAYYEADTWLTDVTKVMLWTTWQFDVLRSGE